MTSSGQLNRWVAMTWLQWLKLFSLWTILARSRPKYDHPAKKKHNFQDLGRRDYSWGGQKMFTCGQKMFWWLKNCSGGHICPIAAQLMAKFWTKMTKFQDLGRLDYSWVGKKWSSGTIQASDAPCGGSPPRRPPNASWPSRPLLWLEMHIKCRSIRFMKKITSQSFVHLCQTARCNLDRA